jgi:hypothetical protein
MEDTQKLSFTREEWRAIKKGILEDRPYHDRVSIGFALRLLQVRQSLKEDHLILDEVDSLEGIGLGTKTKAAEQFRYPPLYPLWHKHFSASRHMLMNIGIRWNADRGGNEDLTAMINEVAKLYGGDPDKWPGVLGARFVEGYFERLRRGLTGDWIIFGRRHEQNYYLDVATHNEGRDQQKLFIKLKNGSSAEFPFLFSPNAAA